MTSHQLCVIRRKLVSLFHISGQHPFASRQLCCHPASSQSHRAPALLQEPYTPSTLAAKQTSQQLHVCSQTCRSAALFGSGGSRLRPPLAATSNYAAVFQGQCKPSASRANQIPTQLHVRSQARGSTTSFQLPWPGLCSPYGGDVMLCCPANTALQRMRLTAHR